MRDTSYSSVGRLRCTASNEKGSAEMASCICSAAVRRPSAHTHDAAPLSWYTATYAAGVRTCNCTRCCGVGGRRARGPWLRICTFMSRTLPCSTAERNHSIVGLTVSGNLTRSLSMTCGVPKFCSARCRSIGGAIAPGVDTAAARRLRC